MSENARVRALELLKIERGCLLSSSSLVIYLRLELFSANRFKAASVQINRNSLNHSSSYTTIFPLLCCFKVSFSYFLEFSLSRIRSTNSYFFCLSPNSWLWVKTSRSMSTCFCTRASFMRFYQKRSSLRCLISAIRCMA